LYSLASVHVRSDQKHQPEVANAGATTAGPMRSLCFAWIRFARRLTSCICKKKKQEKSDPTMPTLLVGVRRWPDGDLTPQHESRTSTVPQQAAKLLGKRTMESPAINISRGFSAALATARCRGIISRERRAPTCKPVTMLDSRVASSRHSTSCWIVRASWPSAPLVAPA
jgi:hypothetical protein